MNIQLKQLLNKTTKLRVQTKLDARFKVSIRKISTYGSKQSPQETNAQLTGKYVL